jgi:hypothetical protein
MQAVKLVLFDWILSDRMSAYWPVFQRLISAFCLLLMGSISTALSQLISLYGVPYSQFVRISTHAAR